MIYSLGASPLPVDVHTLRFATRLRLLPLVAEAGARSTQSALEACLPQDSWCSFHKGAVVLGHARCALHEPKCAVCPACQWGPAGFRGEQEAEVAIAGLS